MRALAVSCLVLVACSPPEAPPPPPPQANAAHFTLECTPHGIAAYDETRSLIPGVKVSCIGHVADLTGAPLEGATVSFRTEAGRVRAEGLSSATGEVEAAYETATPLPRDVDPGVFSQSVPDSANYTGVLLAPLWMEPHHWVEDPPSLLGLSSPVFTGREPSRIDPIRRDPAGNTIRNNPRDNLVTVIAVTDGAEAFTDTNASGACDPGEAFVDLTEPFVDANDNGTWDADEEFIDTNGNQLWDGKNGRWDAVTKVWTQERILWTGMPAREDVANAPSKVVAFSPPRVALTCPSVGYCAQAGVPPIGVATVSLFIADPWFNALTFSADTDGCAWDGDTQPAVAKISDLASAVRSPRLTWPAGDVYAFTVADVRNPAVPPAQQIPPRRPPVGFSRDVRCRSTASPQGGPVEQFSVMFQGTTE